jgi:hypothetical protein
MSLGGYNLEAYIDDMNRQMDQRVHVNFRVVSSTDIFIHDSSGIDEILST